MSDASLPAGRFSPGDFRVGQVFSRAWRVFSRNFFTLTMVTGMASLPPVLLQQPRLPGRPPPLDPSQILASFLLIPFLTMVLNSLSQGIVLHGAFDAMRGRPINLAESGRVGLHRFFRLLGLAIVASLVFVLGFALLIFPGVMLYTMWFVAAPVCVLERASVFRSMRRSQELTKGHRWKIFGLALIIMIPVMIVGFIMGGILGLSAAANLVLVFALGKIVIVIWNAVWVALFSIVVVVAYHDLRVAKEGVDTDQIAAVFE